MKRGPQPPLTPIGDALTLAAHLQFLRRRLRAEPLVVSVQDLGLFDQFKRRNLLIIGGPKYNFAAQQCLREIDELLPYQFRRLRPETSERTVEDPELKRFVARTPETSFASEPERDIDYGCAILAPNPYNENRKVLILAGLTTLSTLGVSQWLQQGRPLMWIRARLLDGFEAIVQCQNTGTTHVSNVRTAALVYLRKP